MSGQGEAKEYYSSASMETTTTATNPKKVEVDDDSDDETMGSAPRHAEQNAAGSGTIDMFASIISSLKGNREEIKGKPIDEQQAVKSHQQFFSSSSTSTEGTAADASSMGSAAAMQALKMFTEYTSGSSGAAAGGQKQSQNAFVGMAMAQASKLFDNQAAAGKVGEGEKKESAVMQAGEMALKIYLQAGGKSGGGSGGLMGLAGKFL